MTFESCAPIHRFVLLARNVKNSFRNRAAANSMIRSGELNTNILIEARSAALAHTHTYAHRWIALEWAIQWAFWKGFWDVCDCDTASCWWYCQSCIWALVYMCVNVGLCACVRVCDTECVFIEWVSVLPILRIGAEIYRTSIHSTHRIHTILPNRTHPSHGMCVPIVQYTNIHQIVCVYLYNRSSSSSSSSSDVYTRTHAHIGKNLLWWIFSSVVDEHFFFWSNIRCNINSETHRKNEKKNERKKCFFFVVVGKIRLKLLANIK